jgi:hypothetical protein
MFSGLLLVSAAFRAPPVLCFFLSFLSLWTGLAPTYVLSSTVGAFDDQVSALLSLPFRTSHHLTLVLVCPVFLRAQVALHFCLRVAFAVYVALLGTVRSLHIRPLFLVSFHCVPVATDSHSLPEELAGCVFSPDCKDHR